MQSIEWLGILSYKVIYNSKSTDLIHGGLDLVVVQVVLDLYSQLKCVSDKSPVGARFDSRSHNQGNSDKLPTNIDTDLTYVKSPGPSEIAGMDVLDMNHWNSVWSLQAMHMPTN